MIIRNVPIKQNPDIMPYCVATHPNNKPRTILIIRSTNEDIDSMVALASLSTL